MKQELEPLTEFYLECHKMVKERIKSETGKYPKEYKRFEPLRINRYLSTLAYKRKSKFNFVAETMSSLIVIHGLPNTNHRTTLLFVGVILQSFKIKFPHYDKRKDNEKWINDCNRYIDNSKEILDTRKEDRGYKEKHLECTKEWLDEMIGSQSRSLGMMSQKSLTTLRTISSSKVISSVILNPQEYIGRRDI